MTAAQMDLDLLGRIVSIFPRTLVKLAAKDAVPALKVANGSAIITYGRRQITLRVCPNLDIKVQCHIVVAGIG